MEKLLTILATAIVCLTIASFDAQPNHEQLGTIKYSILPPPQFNQQNGPGWRFLDGAMIDGTDINIEKTKLNIEYPSIKKIPDGRGVFIRIFNNNRSSTTGDPEGDRAIGSYQQDMYGAHSHDLTFLDRKGDIVGFHNLSGGGVPEQRLTWGDRMPYNNIATDISIDNSGGAETRPRNIVVYAYIKVN